MSRRSKPITIYTIGFTQKSAEEFFTRLKLAGVKRVIDIRLKNESQLAGFSKKPDLAFFLREIGDIDYAHEPDLAPTPDILDQYKKRKGDWRTYESKFLKLIARRKIEAQYTPQFLNQSCLLCSEPTPEHCHRRLVAEYLKQRWGNVNVIHL